MGNYTKRIKQFDTKDDKHDKNEKNEKNDKDKHEKNDKTEKNDKNKTTDKTNTPNTEKRSKKNIHKCTNCEKDFDTTLNEDDSCRYHNGKQTFDTYPKWSCCQKEYLTSHTITVGVVGITGSGKTAVITRISVNDWIDHTRTAGSNDVSTVSSKTILFNSISYTFQFIEIPEPPADKMEIPEHIVVFCDVKVIMFVFQLDNLESLQRLSDLYKKIETAKGSDPFPIILVGNKSDLSPEDRKVTESHIQSIPFKNVYIEFSSKTGSGLEELIDKLYDESDDCFLFNNGCQKGKHKK